MNFRERNGRQRVEQSRVCQSVWLEQLPATDCGHLQGALPRPGTHTVPPQSCKESGTPFYTEPSSLERTGSKPCRSALCISVASKSENLFAPKFLDGHLQKTLSTYSRFVTAMPHIICLWKKMLLSTSRFQRCISMGVTATFSSDNEVQIKPDLKSMLDAYILDIKFIYMHKEFRIQQELTSEWRALCHKIVLFTCIYKC